MITAQYMEIGARAYPLRFTAEGILRTARRVDAPFESLFAGGVKGVCALFYCALLPALPALTLQRAADLMQDALRREPARAFTDCLLRAFCASGFPRAGVTQKEMDGLIYAARRAGMPAPERLAAMTKVEMAEAIDAFEAQTRRELRLLDALAYMQGAYCLRALHAPARYPAAPCMARTEDARVMDAEAMRGVLAAWAGRCNHGDA